MKLVHCRDSWTELNSFPYDNISDYSKLKEFADDNFRVDENGIKFSKWVENGVGKGEITRYEYLSSVQKLVLKIGKNQGLFGNG